MVGMKSSFLRVLAGSEKNAEVHPGQKLSLNLEYIPGEIEGSIDRLITLYRPDSVVVGTGGRKVFRDVCWYWEYRRALHSPIPVIVIRPQRKLKEEMEKPKANPKQGRRLEF
ncbi:hypothetical protein BKA70DRAFT_1433864 [Coprinopsis sp. MPI-PUGE-AT-0042]|nr:hypothetical protein BKA70DRAFT_1433864 [Coprinopsis sp. MPI-PUGE-AT-0042]